MTVRARITVLAALLVAVVLGAAAVAVVTWQRQSLVASLDASLQQRADTLSTELATFVPEVIPNPNSEDRLFQLVADDGTVLAASSNIDGHQALLSSVSSGSRFATVRGLPIEDDMFRVVSVSVASAAGTGTLHIAENIDDLTDSVRSLWVSLAVVIPSVVAALAALVWWLVGRTLQPVDAIRREVASIKGGDLQRRVPEPDTADEIGELARTMNSMLSRLEASTVRLRQFTGDASHELRTPITRMKTLLETQSSGADPALVESLLAETSQLESIVSDLLFLARSDSGTAREYRPVDLDDIVLRELEPIRLGGQVHLDSSRVSAAMVRGDHSQLASAVRNLLQNAVRHARSTVAVSLGEENGEAILTVSDDGPGIPADQRARVFERFARIDDARGRQGGGSGLGLAICRSVITDHGGTILIDEAPEGGARFVVRLPGATS